MAEVLQAPEVRYTQDNLAVANLLVQFPSTRPEDAPMQVRVSVFGDMAETVVSQCYVGLHVVVEGQLHINSVEKDGRTEKRAEINARRIHPIGGSLGASINASPAASPVATTPKANPVSPAPSKTAQPPAGVDFDELPF